MYARMTLTLSLNNGLGPNPSPTFEHFILHLGSRPYYAVSSGIRLPDLPTYALRSTAGLPPSAGTFIRPGRLEWQELPVPCSIRHN